MDLPQPLQAHQAEVERALHEVLEGPTAQGLPLYRMMGYQLGWTDQEGEPELREPPDRLYGTLTLEAAQTGPRPHAAAPAAAAAEFLHQS